MTRLPFNIPLVSSVVAITVAAIVTLVQLGGLASAVLTPRPRQDATMTRLDQYLGEYADALASYLARFDGRSLFFKPKPPPTPPPKIVVRHDKPVAPPPTPVRTRPLSYPGPTVSFVIGDEVWFHDGVRAMVGEEVNGVTVLESDPPWKVKLKYDGFEWDIKLFDKKDLFPDRPPKASKSFPGIEPVADGAGEAVASRR